MQFINSKSFNINRRKKISEDTDIIFVADFFKNDLIGGGELSTQALIDSSNLNIAELHSSLIDMQYLEENQSKHWVFTNIANLNVNLIPTITANLKYSCILYDYSFCKYRSLQKHYAAENVECDCSNDMFGKLISTFVYQADTIWFMSEAQMNVWLEKFPFLNEKNITVCKSSVSNHSSFACCT